MRSLHWKGLMTKFCLQLSTIKNFSFRSGIQNYNPIFGILHLISCKYFAILFNKPNAVSICTRILKCWVWNMEFDELDFLFISNSNFAGYTGSKNLVQTKVPILKECHFGKVKLWHVEHFWTLFVFIFGRDCWIQ